VLFHLFQWCHSCSEEVVYTRRFFTVPQTNLLFWALIPAVYCLCNSTLKWWDLDLIQLPVTHILCSPVAVSSSLFFASLLSPQLLYTSLLPPFTIWQARSSPVLLYSKSKLREMCQCCQYHGCFRKLVQPYSVSRHFNPLFHAVSLFFSSPVSAASLSSLITPSTECLLYLWWFPQCTGHAQHTFPMATFSRLSLMRAPLKVVVQVG